MFGIIVHIEKSFCLNGNKAVPSIGGKTSFNFQVKFYLQFTLNSKVLIPNFQYKI